jgi:monofunctional biosynthetic peptidoglycan transglycosylase
MRYRTISEHLKKAVVVGEDTTFFSHQGIDFFELRQTIEDSWREGKVDRGASTITMQLARNLYLSPERSLLRKLREMIITLQLERSLSKQRILELYLNVVEWGRGIYGAEAAARHYFLKSAADLTPVEAATLAALLPSPVRPRQRALVRRRNRILERMVAIGHITADEFAVARETPLFYVEEPGPERGG